MRLMLAAALMTLLVSAHQVGAGEPPLPRRGSLGVALVPATDGSPVVHGLAPSGPAAQAGLAVGDRILTANGMVVPDVPAFLRALRTIAAGEVMPLVAERSGARQRFNVTAAEPPREQSDAFTTYYEHVRNGDIRLRRLLTLPASGAAPHPALVIVQGVGCDSVHNEPTQAPMYRPIIEAASRAGYATVRIDKPGTGDSEGGPCPAVDYETELAGYRAGLESAFDDPRLDPRQVHVFGHSMGGIMMPSLVRGLPVASVIVYGTGFAPWAEYHVASARRQKALDGLPATDVDKAVEQARHMAAHLYELGWPLSRYRATHGGDAPDPADPEVLFGGKHAEYFRQISRRDLAAEWAGTDLPVLALYGASDFVSFEQDHRDLVDTVNRAHPGRATLQILPRSDHWFRQADDFADSHRHPLADPYNPAVPKAILTWLDARRG